MIEAPSLMASMVFLRARKQPVRTPQNGGASRCERIRRRASRPSIPQGLIRQVAKHGVQLRERAQGPRARRTPWGRVDKSVSVSQDSAQCRVVRRWDKEGAMHSISKLHRLRSHEAHVPTSTARFSRTLASPSPVPSDRAVANGSNRRSGFRIAHARTRVRKRATAADCIAGQGMRQRRPPRAGGLLEAVRIRCPRPAASERDQKRGGGG